MYRTMKGSHVNRYAPRPIVGRVLSGKPPFSRNDALKPISSVSRSADDSVKQTSNNPPVAANEFVKSSGSIGKATMPPSAGDQSQDKNPHVRGHFRTRRVCASTSTEPASLRYQNYETDHMLMMMLTDTNDRSRQ